MCQLVSLDVNGKTINVASLKIKYIKNIIDNISRCNLIDKVVLFGSSLEERCTENSDIDIAIFGKKTKTLPTPAIIPSTTRERNRLLGESNQKWLHHAPKIS